MKNVILFCLCLFIAYNCYAKTDVEIKDATATISNAKSSNEPIIIQGKVTFRDYKQGYICIFAMKKSGALSKTSYLTHINIPKPGFYTLQLPPGIKEIYLGCYNDIDNDGGPRQTFHDPEGWYQINGIKGLLIIDTNIMKDINLDIKTQESAEE